MVYEHESPPSSPLSCFMKSLRVECNIDQLQLVCDNAKSTYSQAPNTSTPPPPETPKTAHKSARWKGCSLNASSFQEAEQSSAPNLLCPPPFASLKRDDRRRYDTRTAAPTPTSRITKSSRQPSTKSKSTGNPALRMISEQNKRSVSCQRQTSLKQLHLEQQIPRRPYRSNSTGSVSMPILPVRRQSIKEILDDAIRCSRSCHDYKILV